MATTRTIMTRTTTAIHEQLRSSAYLSKKHVHPKLSHLMELGGMNTAFARAAGQYLYDFSGHRCRLGARRHQTRSGPAQAL